MRIFKLNSLYSNYFDILKKIYKQITWIFVKTAIITLSKFKLNYYKLLHSSWGNCYSTFLFQSYYKDKIINLSKRKFLCNFIKSCSKLLKMARKKQKKKALEIKPKENKSCKLPSSKKHTNKQVQRVGEV